MFHIARAVSNKLAQSKSEGDGYSKLENEEWVDVESAPKVSHGKSCTEAHSFGQNLASYCSTMAWR